MKMSDIIVTDAIIADLDVARDREDVQRQTKTFLSGAGSVRKSPTMANSVVQLVNALAGAGAISKRSVEETIREVLAREEKATTGIGKGVALPHAKIGSCKKVVGTIGRSSAGIDFNSLDSKPVHIVILLLSNPDDPDEHLQAMETIFKHVQRDIFRKFLRQSQTAEAIAELIQEADEMG